MAVGTVANATQVDGTTLNVAVQLPDGTTQRYTVSLLDSNIKASLEAQISQVAAPTNDALIKANLALVVKGLELTISDPTGSRPPDPTPDDLAVQAFSNALFAWLVLRAHALFGLADQATVDAAAQTVASLYSKGTATQQVRCDQIFSLVRP